MKTYLHLLGAVAAASLLSGCGSDSKSYSDLRADEQALVDKYVAATTTDFGDLPAGGTATYRGFVGGELDVVDPNNDEFVAQLTLTADFAADDVTDGRAYNFRREDNSDIAGELNLTNGSILDNLGTGVITADLEGDLDGVPSSIGLSGPFIDGAQAVRGTAFGSVAGDGIDSGGFIAER